MITAILESRFGWTSCRPLFFKKSSLYPPSEPTVPFQCEHLRLAYRSSAAVLSQHATVILPGEQHEEERDAKEKSQARGEAAWGTRCQRVGVGRDAAGVGAHRELRDGAVVLQSAETIESAAAAPDLLDLARERDAVRSVVPVCSRVPIMRKEIICQSHAVVLISGRTAYVYMVGVVLGICVKGVTNR